MTVWEWRTRSDEDFAEEIKSHISAETTRLVEEEGLNFQDARTQALRSFGNLTRARERFYDGRHWGWLEDLKRDVQHTFRSFRRGPGFAAIAVVTLGLGIGANTAIFSVLNALLLTPLPYQDESRVVRLIMNVPPSESPSKAPLRTSLGVTAAEVRAMRARTQTLSSAGIVAPMLRAWPGEEESARISGAGISTTVLEMLSARPLIGRAFTTFDAQLGTEPVIMLSHAAGQRYFGEPQAAIGRTITLESVLPPRAQYRYTVVGIMPADFVFPSPDTQFWTPFQELNARGAPNRGRLVARLQENVSLEAATAEVHALFRNLRPQSPATTYELVKERDELVADIRPALAVMALGVSLVLLIACVNVSNLLLARASVRQRELAVRAAIGAGRSRLIRQMLTESGILAVLGTVVGILVGFLGTYFLRTVARPAARIDLTSPSVFPRIDEIGVNTSVLLYAAIVSVVVAVLCGLAPALRYSRSDPLKALRGAADRNQSSVDSVTGFTLRNLLMVSEIAFAVVLLIATGVLVRSFLMLTSVETGYDPSRVLTFQVGLPVTRYSDAQLKVFAEAVTDRLVTVSGVEAAAYANQLPMINLRDTAGDLATSPDPKRQPAPFDPDMRLVSRAYFDVMGIRVVAGRGFTEQDREGAERVLVINQALSKRHFGDKNPVDQIVFVGRDVLAWRIVGVVENVRQFGLDQEATPQIFVDIRQWSPPNVPLFPGGAYYAIRTTDVPMSLVPTARQIITQIDPAASLFYIASMEDIVKATVTRQRTYALLLTIFATVGLVLAVTGVYSVVRYSVAQRTREIGIRMALGADHRRVVRMVLLQNTIITAIGIGLGIAGAVAASRLLEGLIFGVEPIDRLTFTTVAIGFLVIATLAALVPATRAARIDPLSALRCQ